MSYTLYKAVLVAMVHGAEVYTSTSTHDPDYEVQYQVGAYVGPKHKGAQLFGFDTYENALLNYESMDHVAIFEARSTRRPEPLPYRALSNSPREFELFWRHPNGSWIETLSGTVVVPRLMLVRELWRNA